MSAANRATDIGGAMGAAPTARRLWAPVIASLTVFAAAALAASAPKATAGAEARVALPSQFWAVELGAATQRIDRAGLLRLRRRGFNTAIVNTKGLTARRAGELRARAARAGFFVLSPCRAGSTTAPAFSS